MKEKKVEIAAKAEAPRRIIVRVRRHFERRVTVALKVGLLVLVSLMLMSDVLDFLGRIAATGILLVAAIFFSYVIHPLVERLGRSMPRVGAILLVYAFLAAIAMLLGVLIFPVLADEAQRFIQAFPQIIVRVHNELLNPSLPLLRYLPAAEREYIANIPAEVGQLIQQFGLQTAQRTLNVLLSTASVIAACVIVPVLSAYLMLDAESIQRSLIGVIPPRRQHKALEVMADLDNVVGGFIRGQLIDGAIVGTMIGVMLWVMHVPYAFLIGVFGGALNFIPYAGAIASFFPAVLLALLYNGSGNAAITALLFAVIHQLDGNVIAPRILRENVGLSPVWIILAILAGSELFGLIGTFLAVPTAAMLRVLLLHFLPRRRTRPAAEAA